MLGFVECVVDEWEGRLAYCGPQQLLQEEVEWK